MDAELDLGKNTKIRVGKVPQQDSYKFIKEGPLRIKFPTGKIRIFGHFVDSIILLLVLAEMIVSVVAVYSIVHWLGVVKIDQIALFSSLPRVLFIAFILTASMAAMNLYHARHRVEFSSIFIRMLIALMIGVSVLLLLYPAFPSFFLGQEKFLVLALFVALLAICLVRLVFYKFVDGNVLKRRVMVIGAGEKALTISELRRKSDRRGFDIHGFVRVSENTPIRVDTQNILTSGKSLCEYALANDIDEIVIALDDRRQQLPVHDLLDCRMNGIEVTDILDFFEREAAKIRVDLVSPSWFIHATGFRLHYRRSLIKRLFDVVISSFLLIIFSPIIMVTALMIWLENGCRGPILYLQTRVGEGGRLYQILKFRSMIIDAEKGGQAQWAVQDDPRITKIGAFIRKFRIDEVPQLLNVLTGTMSLVGPRPERPEFVQHLSKNISFFDERHRVKPGITGWAQICYSYGASEKDSVEKLQYDLYYVKNHTFLLDVSVLIQTVEVVLFGKGAR